VSINELIAIVSKSYPDNCVQDVYRNEYENADILVGDTLAVFIARELHETFDPDASDRDQLETAQRKIETAMHELRGVVLGIADELAKMERNK
jgi:hypothetical protein